MYLPPSLAAMAPEAAIASRPWALVRAHSCGTESDCRRGPCCLGCAALTPCAAAYTLAIFVYHLCSGGWNGPWMYGQCGQCFPGVTLVQGVGQLWGGVCHAAVQGGQPRGLDQGLLRLTQRLCSRVQQGAPGRLLVPADWCPSGAMGRSVLGTGMMVDSRWQS